ncbi:MAG: acyl-CoA dehydrogenase family protein [Dehalococcoidia bacterium]|nr:acyl-CoA dehydrogenase family protein [Dehalococcoidia bacterium]MDD5648731.1 acyl-CoA dehydrogenase family protein [Dehalococcoidia bacterium]
MIDFELTAEEKAKIQEAHAVAEKKFRPVSRYYDEHEHEEPQEIIDFMWENRGKGFVTGLGVVGALMVEELCWGDAGLYLASPGPGLGGAAVFAAGTKEQWGKFLARFNEGKPKWGAMAMTEPGCGSDTSAIQATATRDGDYWVLNGEKIFVTMGHRALDLSEGIIVVWASVDKSAGRAGMKSFVVEAGTPGMKVEKKEKKLGIKASDTVTVTFDNCRIPFSNILGKAEVKSKTEGFKGAMATFDVTRPMVAAQALGVTRAALDMLRDEIDKRGIKIRYELPRSKQTALERDFIEMEANWRAAHLLMIRAMWQLGSGQSNALEASMSKAKAGRAATLITQRAVELMGPLGYSRKNLFEKFMRDAKINDIFEGTGQINTLVVARRLLDYTRDQLK